LVGWLVGWLVSYSLCVGAFVRLAPLSSRRSVLNMLKCGSREVP